jgi:hypothetical protein
MIKTTILAAIILFSATMAQQVYAPDILNLEESSIEGKAIPDWVRNNFEWYVDGQIDEKTLLTSMNWMFDNNIMHLSEKAAQEVQELREENKKLRAAIDQEAGTIEFGDGEHGSVPSLGSAVPGVTAGYMKIGDIKADIDTSTGEVFLPLVLKTNAKNLQPGDEITIILYPAPGAAEEPYNNYRVEVEASQTDKWTIEHEIGHWLGMAPQSSDMPMEQISFNYGKIDFATKTIDDIMTKGGTASTWEEGISSFSQQGMRASVAPELEGIIVLYNSEIDKKTQQIDAELKIIQQWLDIISEKEEMTTDRMTSATTGQYTVQYNESDLDFITRTLEHTDQKINALNTGLMVLEQKLSSVGDDAQLANIDLQNKLQQQQQTLQTLSNVSKMFHDTAMSIIRKIG